MDPRTGCLGTISHGPGAHVPQGGAVMAHTTFRALRFEQRGQTLYLGFAPASTLLEYTHIDRYNPALANDDLKQGYQREPEQGRLSRLAMNMIRKEGGGI